MFLRVGKVTNIYPETGKVKVLYEDTNNTSLPLPMLTMNGEYSMPEVGDKVVTVHMENGSSKGFVLGTYYSDNNTPKATSGYRKDLGGGAYIKRKGEALTIHAIEITLSTSHGEITLTKEGLMGESGAIYTPVVSEEGVLSWTNDKGLENPEPVNIKGPKGDQGTPTTVNGKSGEKITLTADDIDGSLKAKTVSVSGEATANERIDLTVDWGDVTPFACFIFRVVGSGWTPNISFCEFTSNTNIMALSSSSQTITVYAVCLYK